MTPPRRTSANRASDRGFTLVELTVVLAIGAVLLGVTVVSLTTVQSRTAVRSAAQHFSRDLAQARTWAIRTHEAVTISFDEAADSLLYRVVSEGGGTIVRRSFRRGSEIRLSGMDLMLAGDSLRFESDGVATIPSGGVAATATAEFAAGARVYRVRFNARGTGEVEAG
jgi:prepilin-type N-terminal cleavage/methylation domain-containing protein